MASYGFSVYGATGAGVAAGLQDANPMLNTMTTDNTTNNAFLFTISSVKIHVLLLLSGDLNEI